MEDPATVPERGALFMRAREDVRAFGLRLPHSKAVVQPASEVGAEPAVQLFDLHADPAELRDLSSERPEEAARMLRTITNILAKLEEEGRSEEGRLEEAHVLMLEKLGYTGVDEDR